MKELIKLLCAASLLAFLGVGCDDSNDDLYELPKYIYELNNQSGVAITISLNDRCGNLPASFTIENGKSYSWVNNVQKYYYQWFPFDAGTAPFTIRYGEDVTINAAALPSARQLMNESNWVRRDEGEKNDNLYRTIYTFTAADYEWATQNAIKEE
ncbi:MAG: hypothetical protein IKY82_01105 [Alistipes sp.]|nr:hypothetical protein [Alistipes sp.]